MKRVSILLSLIILTSFGVPSFAQTSKKYKPKIAKIRLMESSNGFWRYKGSIVNLSSESITIRSKDGREFIALFSNIQKVILTRKSSPLLGALAGFAVSEMAAAIAVGSGIDPWGVSLVLFPLIGIPVGLIGGLVFPRRYFVMGQKKYFDQYLPIFEKNLATESN